MTRTVPHRRRSAAAARILALLVGGLPIVAQAAPARGPGGSVPAGRIGGDALHSAATDPATRGFYERNDWKAVWTESATHALERALADRSAQGLDRVSFLDRTPPTAGAAEREVARTRAALGYAAALARGYVDPTRLHQVYTLPRPQPDLAGGLADAIARGELARWFASLPPQDDDYAKLSQAYRAAERNAQGGASEASPIPASGAIRVGDTDDRVPSIVQELTDEGYLSDAGAQRRTQAGGGARPSPQTAVPAPCSGADPSGGPGEEAASASSAGDPSRCYTPRIADAVKRLQQDFGITRDGVVGPETLGVLNLQPGDRARALAVALERRRWLERDPPATRIDVNIAAARLRYYRDGRQVDSRKVIVGKPDKATPLLMAPIYRLVANPTWTVPKSIENSEMAHVGPAYLKSHDMVRRHGYLVQLSGPHNALGLVKFDMKDDQAIYLHDTGSPSLFDRSQRHLSHGCVRVDDALGFAGMIARDEGVEDAWRDAHAGHDQQFVELPRRIPVRLLYWNVFVDTRGEVAFRTDPYGWNAPVAQALGFTQGSTRRAEAGPVDIGP